MKGDRAFEALLEPVERPRQGLATLAALSTLLPVFVIGGLALSIGSLSRTQALEWLAALVIAMFLTLPALAVLQADIRCNVELAPRARNWWLASLVTIPGAGVVYWRRHLR
jgi:hypothetical protein